MPIKREQEHPRGVPAESEPIVVGHQFHAPWILDTFQRWLVAVDEGPRDRAVEGRRWRASWSADRCDRQLQYHLRGTPEDMPRTIADEWRMNLGKIVGRQILPFLIEAVGEVPDQPTMTVEAEVPTDLMPLGIDGSASVELLLKIDGVPKHVIEIKTINGMGFKEVAIDFRGLPRPRWGHVVQTCVQAAAYRVPGTLVYIATELIGADIARRKELDDLDRFVSAWRFTPEEVMAVAAGEMLRIAMVEEHITNDELAPRRIDDVTARYHEAIIHDPSKGTWTLADADDDGIIDTGTIWYCAYCPFQKTCLTDGP